MLHRRLAAAVLGPCLLASLAVAAQDGRSERIDALFAAQAGARAPGFAVLVVRDGVVLHRAGYDMADLERGVPIGPDSCFRLASLSKQFTAMAVMVLHQARRLHYDDPLVQVLPELEARYGDGITIRHLLNHTSGLPDYYGAMDQFPAEGMPTNEDGLHVYAKWGEPRFEPGSRFEYSNPGYEMLALAAERVAKKPLAELMREAVFEPAGMRTARVLDTPGEHFANRVYGYRRKPDGSSGWELFDDDRLNKMLGAGGVYASLDDLYQWDQALYGDAVVSQATLEEAFTPATLTDERLSDYGFGWALGTWRGHRLVAHAGGWVAFRTYIMRLPDEHFTVVVLSNGADGSPHDLATQIAELYVEPAEAGADADAGQPGER